MGGRILTGEINCSDIKVTTGLEVEGRTNHVAVSEGTKDLDITINRKEYNIVGDEIYIPKLYDDAPQWLKDLVDVVVEVGVEANNADLLGQVQDLINQLANATVPLNTFTQSIIALNLEDARINTVVETLNSNFSDATSNINAQIIDVRNTFVSKDEAAATIANVISAEIDNGVLQNMATVGHVATALATETDARAADYTALESSIADESEATATAINTINTYVGIDQAGASTGTGLSAYLVDSNGVVGGADSQVANAVYIDNGVPKSKWEYGSIINIGGVNYTSGFGLKTVGSASEFWIDASRFKFTNSNVTGSVAPFTIDATGVTPQVKFNGVVEFSNVSNVPQLGSTPQEVVNAVNSGQTTTINGGKITTGSISAKTIYTSDAFVGHTLQSIDYNGINGFILKSNAAGTSVDPTIYGAYIKGSTLEGSSIKLREITVLTDSNHETKAIIGASSILSGSIWTYGIYPYNSTASTRNRLAKSSNNTVVFAGNTVNSNVSSYVSYRGWVSLAVSTGGVQSGSYPYSYNNVLTVTIDGTSHTFSADTQISPYTFPCGLTLVTVFTIMNINTGSGYTCLFIKPYCASFTLTSGANLTIGVSNLAGSLIMDSKYGNEVIVYNI